MNSIGMNASQEVIQHHLKEHFKHCEIEDPTGCWMSCPDGKFAVVVCQGCFEVIFTGTHPDPEERCEHADAFFEHLQRNLPTPPEDTNE
jgi:hypothetical protein